MTAFTLQRERREDQIRTYVLIERSSGRSLRMTLLILLLLGTLTLLGTGLVKHAGAAAMKTMSSQQK